MDVCIPDDSATDAKVARRTKKRAIFGGVLMPIVNFEFYF